MESPIYVDFDDTLVHSVENLQTGDAITIVPRPGAQRFLHRLAKISPVYILSYAVREHVERGLRRLGDARRALSGILSREDLQPVISALDRIMTSREPLHEQQRKIDAVEPIVPQGVIFDDQPVGSWYYLVKSTAAGIGGKMWVQVPPYDIRNRNDSALDHAYRKFHKTFVGTQFIGGQPARSVV